MPTRHHCLIVRDKSNGAKASWKIYHYQFEHQGDYDRFMWHGMLPAESEETWNWKPVPVPKGNIKHSLDLVSPTKRKAISAAFAALDNKTATIHHYEPLDDDVPVFIEEPGGRLLQVTRADGELS